MSPYALWVVGAALAHGAIALVLLFVMGAIRLPLVARGKIQVRDIALSRDPWPEQEKRVSQAFDNQFQLPVLFYLACGISLFYGSIWIEAVIAWLFVGSRIVHATIFASSNNVMWRFPAYTLGYGILIVFWLELLARLFFIWVWSRT